MKRGRLPAGLARLATVALVWVGAGPLQAETPVMVQARAPLKLIRAPEVQAELGLLAEQVQTVEKAAEQVDGPLWQMRDLPAEKVAEPAQRLSRQFANNNSGAGFTNS